MCDTEFPAHGFHLRIELGNAEMNTPEDVGKALHKVADKLQASSEVRYLMEEATIYDVNGNNVGEFKYAHGGSDLYDPDERLTLEELEALPVLEQGYTANLYISTPTHRVWLERTGVEDGEPFAETVTVEHRTESGRWETLERYNAEDPSEVVERVE